MCYFTIIFLLLIVVFVVVFVVVVVGGGGFLLCVRACVRVRVWTSHRIAAPQKFVVTFYNHFSTYLYFLFIYLFFIRYYYIFLGITVPQRTKRLYT